MATLVFTFASAAPAHHATTSSPFLLPETTLTVAGETPPDCVCCAVTSASMTAYCMREMPMGDLHMAELHFCDDHASQVIEVGGEITTRSPQCAAYCNHRLAEVRNADTCGIPCAKVPTCDECVPPPRAAAAVGAAAAARRARHAALPPGAGAVLRGDAAPAAEVLLLVRAAERLRGRDGSATPTTGTAGCGCRPRPSTGSSTCTRRGSAPAPTTRAAAAAASNAGGYVTAWPGALPLALRAPAPRNLPLVAAREVPATSARRQCAPLPRPLPTPMKAPTPFGAAPFSGKAPLGPWRAALPAGPARFGSTSLLAEQPRDPPRGAARGARAAVPLLRIDHSNSTVSFVHRRRRRPPPRLQPSAERPSCSPSCTP